MDRPHGVFEPLDRQHRKTLFSLFGVPVSFTTLAPLSLPMMVGGMVPLAWALKRDEGLGAVLGTAVRLGLTLFLSNYAHSIGHILAGRLVGAPMNELIVTATRQVNAYFGDQSGYPTSTHITRALGGPVGNALVALVAVVAWTLTDSESEALRDASIANAGIALMAMLPMESVDGGSILAALRDAKESE